MAFLNRRFHDAIKVDAETHQEEEGASKDP